MDNKSKLADFINNMRRLSPFKKHRRSATPNISPIVETKVAKSGLTRKTDRIFTLNFVDSDEEFATNVRSNVKKPIYIEERRSPTSETTSLASLTTSLEGSPSDPLSKTKSIPVIQRQLKRCCFGAVYQGKLADSTRVAVKRIKCVNNIAYLESDHRDLKCATAELNAMIRMKSLGGHENILPLLAYFHSRNSLSIITPLCSGGELFEHIDTKGFGVSKAQSYFRQLVQAITFLHRNGMAHNDISLENVLLVCCY
jgi:hypothetical protein